jgi:mRNA-degrading endonuclease YafQ of YafQ-DinJ toxin-antitoxin module
VKRVLLPSSAFLRAARRLAKRHPAMADDFQAALELLAEDAHHPALRTHKLKGKLAKSWACSAGYDLRIVFQFVRHGAHEAILLEVVGIEQQSGPQQMRISVNVQVPSHSSSTWPAS